MCYLNIDAFIVCSTYIFPIVLLLKLILKSHFEYTNNQQLSINQRTNNPFSNGIIIIAMHVKSVKKINIPK